MYAHWLCLEGWKVEVSTALVMMCWNCIPSLVILVYSSNNNNNNNNKMIQRERRMTVMWCMW